MGDSTREGSGDLSGGGVYIGSATEGHVCTRTYTHMCAYTLFSGSASVSLKEAPTCRVAKSAWGVPSQGRPCRGRRNGQSSYHPPRTPRGVSGRIRSVHRYRRPPEWSTESDGTTVSAPRPGPSTVSRHSVSCPLPSHSRRGRSPPRAPRCSHGPPPATGTSEGGGVSPTGRR